MDKAMVLAICLLAIAPTRPANADASRNDMDAEVTDTFNQAKVIIQALQNLEAPPNVSPIKYRTTINKSPDPLAAKKIKVNQNPPQTSAAWMAKHLGPDKRNTVFSSFVVSIDELTPTSYRVSVVSTEYCEEIQVKDRLTKKIIAWKNLDDEKAFSIDVTNHRLDKKFSLSIAVLKEGNLNYAYVPLLDEGGDTEKINP
jgi:hypothetical protein